MPNSFAFLMLAIWPLVTLVIFRRNTREIALIWTILAAYLLLPPLPAAFDFPLLPPFNKHTIPLFSIIVILALGLDKSSVSLPRMIFVPVMILFPGALRSLLQGIKSNLELPDTWLGKALVALFVLGPTGTVLTNGEPLIFQTTVLPGLRVFDIFALVVTQFLILAGFLLARKYLRTPETQRFLLVALMIGGLLYSLPMLLEVVISPQLNIWIYGYFQAVFEQMIRGGGFRPIVFLNHGIWVAFFIMTSAVAALALWQGNPVLERRYYPIAIVYLVVVLVLSKTLGPLLLLLFLLPIIWFFRQRTQIGVAVFLGILALSYPLMKTVDLVPEQTLLEQATRIDPQRAASLQFRFENEDALLTRANIKPVFGWGSWGRNQLHDPFSGEITSVSDGRWVIVLGVFGWIGFFAEFGLLLYPLFLVWKESRLLSDDEISPYLGPLALLLGVNIVDLLPNATLTPLTWLIAGALLGYGEALRRSRLAKNEKLVGERASPRRRTLL